MFINVRVIPRAKKNQLVELARDSFKVYLTATPQDNKANKALIKFLANYFDIKQGAVNIVRGLTSQNKTIEIL
ncbi:MAG: DUF167 domain-containing protein [Candidatus Omnitrophota bacterium]